MGLAAGFSVGTVTLGEVGGGLGLLALATAGWLSMVVGDRRRPEDTFAVFAYLAYAAGFGLLSFPSVFDAGPIATPAQAFGALFVGLLLAVGWVGYVATADGGDGERRIGG